MTRPPVRYEVRGCVALLTLDRPRVLNAINAEMQEWFLRCLTLADRDQNVTCLVITGAGHAFAAGADINQLQAYEPTDGLLGHMQHLYDRLEHLDMPTIAAVNGYALGGGCELALACDIRIASTDAAFGLPETQLGVARSGRDTEARQARRSWSRPRHDPDGATHQRRGGPQ